MAGKGLRGGDTSVLTFFNYGGWEEMRHRHHRGEKKTLKKRRIGKLSPTKDKKRKGKSGGDFRGGEKKKENRHEGSESRYFPRVRKSQRGP